MYSGNINGVFTLPDTDTDAETDTDAIGFETHCVGFGTSVGKGKICVGVGQCEHTIKQVHTFRFINGKIRVAEIVRNVGNV